jgi:hypothetical protein
MNGQVFSVLSRVHSEGNDLSHTDRRKAIIASERIARGQEGKKKERASKRKSMTKFEKRPE